MRFSYCCAILKIEKIKRSKGFGEFNGQRRITVNRQYLLQVDTNLII